MHPELLALDLTAPRVAVLLAVGVAAGVFNGVAGGGTLLTFPTLLALGIPALSADAWTAGKNATPAKRSMNPKNAAAAGAASSSAPVALKVQKSPADLQRELDAANAKIAALEAELAKLRA